MSEIRDKAGKRLPATAFKKGQSGNPGGRKKRTPEELDLIAACKAKAPAALNVLLSIMENGDQEKNRLSAALAILERGFGKPEQPIKANVSGAVAIEVVIVDPQD